MQGFVRLAALLLVAPLCVAAATPAAPLKFTGSAWVDVDAAGKPHVVGMEKVSKLGDVPKLAPIAEHINGRLKDAIESWQFVPATRDGVAVPSHTHVLVNMEALDDGAGGMAVRIRSANTGPSLQSFDRAPLILAATRAQAEGMVRLKLAFDAEGKVSAVEVADSKEYWKGKFSGLADKWLRKEAVKAAHAWRLSPEVVDGRPIPGTGSVAIVFCLSSGCGAAPLPSNDSADPREFASTDPAVKLRSNVAGTAL